MKKYLAVGIMSGTSVDGADLVLTSFYRDNKWNFEILKAHTYNYTKEWKNILRGVKYNSPVFEVLKLNNEYGIFLGNLVNDFLKDVKTKPDVIASHGHTIFHQPFKGVTYQIGNGNNIAAITGIPVITDFRSMDVAFGGQGAPLVPMGDLHLFSEYKYCLNLGGFANISIKENDIIRAFDICPVNIILNLLVSDLGLDFDKDGLVGNRGDVNKKLLSQLNRLAYYRETGPKSLGIEWLDEEFIPVLYYSNLSLEDKMRTVYEHIVQQIKNSIPDEDEKMLITGGGALNSYLVLLLKQNIKQQIVIPSYEIVSFKEALIFAFLGVLRVLGKNNTYASVTGAKHDNCGGSMYI